MVEGLDENGRPIVDYDFVPTSESKTARNSCPGAIEAIMVLVLGLNPNQKIMVASIEACNRMVKQVDTYKAGDPFGVAVRLKQTKIPKTMVISWQLTSFWSIKWKYKDKYPMVSGALSTDGDVVFTANQEGYAMGFDALNETCYGSFKWDFRQRPPITWEQAVNNVYYNMAAAALL